MDWKWYLINETFTLILSFFISYWLLLFFQSPITPEKLIGGAFAFWTLPTLFEARKY